MSTDTAPAERLAQTERAEKAIEHLHEAVEQNDTPYVIVFRQAVADALAELADLRGELAVSNQAHDWAMRELAAALNERDDLRGVLAAVCDMLGTALEAHREECGARAAYLSVQVDYGDLTELYEALAAPDGGE